MAVASRQRSKPHASESLDQFCYNDAAEHLGGSSKAGNRRSLREQPMSELMRAMIGCVTLTTVLMMIFTFLMRTWLLQRLKKSIKVEYDVQLERLRCELRDEVRDEVRDECRRQLSDQSKPAS